MSLRSLGKGSSDSTAGWGTEARGAQSRAEDLCQQEGSTCQALAGKNKNVTLLVSVVCSLLVAEGSRKSLLKTTVRTELTFTVVWATQVEVHIFYLTDSF